MRILETETIKNTIRTSKYLLEGGNPIALDAETVGTTNCYAYSLGIMYHGIRGKDFIPGFTENLPYFGENAEELMKKIEIDLENLRISFRKIGLEEEIQLQENEYLVKVFYTPPNRKLPAGDFHFIRQDRATEVWFHKMGWHRQPDVVQSDPGYEGPIPGSEPSSITSHDNDGFSYEYAPVVYLAIIEN